jgi:hypothetical protein
LGCGAVKRCGFNLDRGKRAPRSLMAVNGPGPSP